MDKVHLHYIKGANLRPVHCDGVIGGVTPRGYISMSCFSERAPLPKVVVHQINENGTLGEALERDAKDGVVRSVEVELLFDHAMAAQIIDWLQFRMKEYENRFAAKTDEGEK